MLANKPNISIVLPTFNHGKFIEGAIKSIKSACSREYELIIINDGSTDNTSEILRKLPPEPNLTIIEQVNIGLAESLNVGFKLSKGSYLTWTSADNLYKKSALDIMANYLDQYQDIDMVYANVELIDDKSKFFYNSTYRIPNQSNFNSSILNLPRNPETLCCYSDNFINACFLYRSWIPSALGGYKKELLGYEDYEYWLRILSSGKISHLGIDDCLYQYRVHDQSLTKQLNAENLAKSQRKIVSQYYYLNKLKSNKIAPRKPDEIIELDTNTEFLNFANSLPIQSDFNLNSILKFNFKDTQSYTCSAPLSCPDIMSRAINSDFKAHKLAKKTKFSVNIFIPNFIIESEFKNLIKFINNNSHVTFVCIISLDSQRIFIEKLKEHAKNNLVIIDISNEIKLYDEQLPEEKYLPYVYSLSNTKFIICPVQDQAFLQRVICTFSAKVQKNCILIGEKKIDSPPFCKFKTWDQISNILLTETSDESHNDSYTAWLHSISIETYCKKVTNLINLNKSI